jgi:hypothetical protein
MTALPQEARLAPAGVKSCGTAGKVGRGAGGDSGLKLQIFGPATLRER